MLMFYFVSREITINNSVNKNTSSVHISWYLFMKGVFWMINLTKSPTLSLFFFFVYERVFLVQAYPDLSFVIFANTFGSHFGTFCSKMYCILIQCLEGYQNTFLCFFLWNTKTWSPWWFDLIFLQFLLFVHYMSQMVLCCYLLDKLSPKHWKIMFLYPSVPLLGALLSR